MENEIVIINYKNLREKMDRRFEIKRKTGKLSIKGAIKFVVMPLVKEEIKRNQKVSPRIKDEIIKEIEEKLAKREREIKKEVIPAYGIGVLGAGFPVEMGKWVFLNKIIETIEECVWNKTNQKEIN